MQKRKEQPIPAGWALDRDGNITTDAQVACDAGKLLPIGGFEVTSGYKGTSHAIKLIEKLIKSVQLFFHR